MSVVLEDLKNIIHYSKVLIESVVKATCIFNANILYTGAAANKGIE